MKMYKALVRKRGEDEWHDVPFNGLPFYCGYNELIRMVMTMSEAFPMNEYRIEETDLHAA